MLKLDFDNKNVYEIYNQVAERFSTLERLFQITASRSETSSTTHGVHIRIAFKSELPIDDKDIVFMQLFLGSDHNRELFNWKRVRAGLKKWNVLFERKYNNKMELVSHEETIDS